MIIHSTIFSYCCLYSSIWFEPPTEEEEEEEEKGLLVEKNDKRAYNGPFADLEEENFYRMIPNLEELIPSLYAKKNKKKEEKVEEEEEKVEEEGIEKQQEEEEKVEEEVVEKQQEELEKEITAMDENVMKEEEEEEEIEEEEETTIQFNPTLVHTIHLQEITNISFQEKSELLMQQLMNCYSSKEIDDVGSFIVIIMN